MSEINSKSYRSYYTCGEELYKNNEAKFTEAYVISMFHRKGHHQVDA